MDPACVPTACPCSTPVAELPVLSCPVLPLCTWHPQLWTQLIAATSHASRPDLARRIYSDMLAVGLRPNQQVRGVQQQQCACDWLTHVALPCCAGAMSKPGADG